MPRLGRPYLVGTTRTDRRKVRKARARLRKAARESRRAAHNDAVAAELLRKE